MKRAINFEIPTGTKVIGFTENFGKTSKTVEYFCPTCTKNCQFRSLSTFEPSTANNFIFLTIDHGNNNFGDEKRVTRITGFNQDRVVVNNIGQSVRYT
jgi:hypothetical protein